MPLLKDQTHFFSDFTGIPCYIRHFRRCSPCPDIGISGYSPGKSDPETEGNNALARVLVFSELLSRYRATDKKQLPMSSPQFFPIPGELHALACETVSQKIARLPFERDGVQITGELVGVTLECLNAEFSKTLPVLAKVLITAPAPEGLDRCLEQRLNLDGRTVAPVIAEILCRAGIVEKTEVLDRTSHRKARGIRLLPLWKWHTASTPVKIVRNIAGTAPGSLSASWMNLCPVCRTGTLDRVSGKQLFGLPYTEHFVACSDCGAKFVPEDEEFRLVSISRISDPLWKRLLDKTHSPEEWSAIAGATDSGTTAMQKPVTVKGKPEGKPLKQGVFLPMKNGTIALQCGEKTLYFKPVRLVFSGSVRIGSFSWAQKPLREILDLPAYAHLKEIVFARYFRYLPLRSGLFLWERKERHDPFYREFLNPSGDEKFGIFRMKERDDAGRNGLFLVVNGGEIVYGGCSHGSFGNTINEYFGRVSSRDCYLDGDEIRCRINALLTTKKPDAGIYVHCIENPDECRQVAETLGLESRSSLTLKCGIIAPGNAGS